MSPSEKLSASQRANRRFPALMAFWFAFCLANLKQEGLSDFGLMATIDALIGLICCVAWLVFTPRRLDELKFGRFWTALLAAPFALAVFALWKEWSAAFWSALLIAVIAQFVLYFLAPHNAEPSNQRANPGEPAA